MRFKAFALAAVAVFATLGTAEAAPVLLLPDLTFAAVNPGRTGGYPVLFSVTDGFRMSIDTAAGDHMALNTGSGFDSDLTGSIFELHLGPATILDSDRIRFGPGSVSVNLIMGDGSFSGATFALTGPLTLERTTIGADGLAFMTVTGVTGTSPYHVGQTLALDLHLFNITSLGGEGQSLFGANVKGDIAPVIPEPATITLLGVGLLGFAARARRKLVQV